MEIKTDYSDLKFQENGKLKLLIIVGTRPEIIRLGAVISKCRKYFDCILAHTGQNYDYNLNGIFFHDLKLKEPDVYMNAVGDDLGATVGNIINCSYKLMNTVKPDALLILGDTNSCLSAIAAKRLHIPIFHMEAGNRCKDECLPEETNRRIVDIISDVNLAYSEHARKYLHECGLPKERVYVTGSPMAEVLHKISGRSSNQIFWKNWGLSLTNTFFCPPTGKRISTPKRIFFRCLRPSIKWLKSTICRFCTPVIPGAKRGWKRPAFSWISGSSGMSLWDFTITTICR